MNATEFFAMKLDHETDCADVADDLTRGRPDLVVIDARVPELYERGHVPGAINFPHRTMSAESVQRLPREALFVTYCDGIGCNASTKAALKLAGFGFRVKEMLGGIDWWMRDGLSVARGAEAGSMQPAAAIACGC
ncbi:MAG TPA: rhodanese-like domain-containing protein [Thermoanaerobaculia bacterium]|nr:rhodanese-like domain-containing protein [Thermoanaerobaculia bacterium]